LHAYGFAFPEQLYYWRSKGGKAELDFFCEFADRLLARLDVPGVLHHTIIRGIERRNIFRDNKDRDNFIDCLSYFGKKVSESRKAYLSYVKKGIDQGRRPELTGGGLVRSLGGWSMIKKLRLKGQDRIKGDERILGDSEFVKALLSDAKEKLERSYKLNALGYDLKKISLMVSKIYDIEIEEIYSKGRRKVQVEARDLLCYWAVRELGISCTDLAKQLGMTQPGVGYAVNRGEKIAKENKYQLP
jgi:hypothetical protein